MNVALESEVQKLFAKATDDASHAWNCIITAGGVDYYPTKVLSIHNNQDYVHNYGDVLMAELVFPMGTWQYDIVPNQSNIIATLQRIPMGRYGNSTRLDANIPHRQYRAVLSETTRHELEGKLVTARDRDTANLSKLLTVHVQLIDLTLERLRLKQSGILTKGYVKQVITTLYTSGSSNLGVNEDTRCKGVIMTEPHNTTYQDHINIPARVRVPDVAKFIQNECGVYNNDITAYYQRGYWYVFPKYDFKRKNTTSKTLTILRVPPNRYPTVERTYFTENGSVTMLATSIGKHVDNVDALELNEGNGARFLNADVLMEGFVETGKNKAHASRGKNLNEIKTSDRPTGLNNAPFRVGTSNIHVELSKISSRQGTLYSVGWENSNSEVLYPGMPVQVIYQDGSALKQLDGTLIGCDEHSSLDGNGITARRHRANAVLSIFLNS